MYDNDDDLFDINVDNLIEKQFDCDVGGREF